MRASFDSDRIVDGFGFSHGEDLAAWFGRLKLFLDQLSYPVAELVKSFDLTCKDPHPQTIHPPKRKSFRYFRLRVGEVDKNRALTPIG